MNIYLPGFEPDAAERAQLRFINGVLDLRQFDKIFISVSGGKDSHAMLFLVRDLADRQGVPREKLLAMYADTGMEWHNAAEHVQALCKAAGVELKIVYPFRPMLKQMEWQIKNHGDTVGFPTPQCRYCTNRNKVSPMDKFTRNFQGKLLKVTGERWAESKARSTYTEFVSVPRLNSRDRQVFGYRPMLAFSESDIWTMIRDTGVQRHVYISGPMTGIKNLNREAFESAEKKIQEMGHVALNPHRFPEMDTYEDYLLLDLEMIAMAADAIALLPGWENSPGSKRELAVAIQKGIEVMLIA